MSGDTLTDRETGVTGEYESVNFLLPVLKPCATNILDDCSAAIIRNSFMLGRPESEFTGRYTANLGETISFASKCWSNILESLFDKAEFTPDALYSLPGINWIGATFVDCIDG